MGARAHSRGEPPEVVEEWKWWVVDDIVLIDDDDLLQAMKLSADRPPAGALRGRRAGRDPRARSPWDRARPSFWPAAICELSTCARSHAGSSVVQVLVAFRPSSWVGSSLETQSRCAHQGLHETRGRRTCRLRSQDRLFKDPDGNILSVVNH